MKRVVIESPFAGRGDTEMERAVSAAENLDYLRACMADCLRRGESPYASHGLYTQPGVLRDDVPEEREAGIAAGFAWREVAEYTVFYTDRGWSSGMDKALADCAARGLTYTLRKLPGYA